MGQGDQLNHLQLLWGLAFPQVSADAEGKESTIRSPQCVKLPAGLDAYCFYSQFIGQNSISRTLQEGKEDVVRWDVEAGEVGASGREHCLSLLHFPDTVLLLVMTPSST